MFAPIIDATSLSAGQGVVFHGHLGGYDFGATIGASVSAAGDVNGDGFDDLIIGAPGTSRFTAQGESYVIFGSPSGFAAAFDLSVLDGSDGFAIRGAFSYGQSGNSGSAVAWAGDVNGDGVDDVLIGDSVGDRGYDFTGSAYLVFGSQTRSSSLLELSSLGKDGLAIDNSDHGHHEFLGEVVGGAGDVNGDGIGDFFVGAPGEDRAYVVFGQKNMLPVDLDLAALDGRNGFVIIDAGLDIGAAGDLNHDGIDDIVVSGKSGGHVIFGAADGFPASLSTSAVNGVNGFRFGEAWYGSVSSAGDFNGDGIDDLVIGDGSARPNGRNSGAVYVVFGSASGLPPDVDLRSLDGRGGIVINGAARDDWAGGSVSCAGDVNGDGIDDVIIGAVGVGEDHSGAGYVVFGSTLAFNEPVELSSLDGRNGFALLGRGERISFGSTVSGAGDVNADGIDDLVVGAPGADLDEAFTGAAYLVFGRLDDPEVLVDGGGDGALEGGGNDDRLSGQGGDDLLIGLRGDDILDGGAGDDSLEGGAGADTLSGGSGRDRVSGGDDSDRLYGGSGNDRIAAGRGDDRVNGGSGDDRISGQTGNDRISGSVGNDKIDGGSGNDKLHGSDGDDFLMGGPGTDVLDGGAGTDVFVFASLGDRGDRITGFQVGRGGDVIDVSSLLGRFADGDDLDHFLKLDQRGSHTYVQIDTNGGGDRYIDLAVLKFTQGLSLARLQADGNIDVLG